MYKQTCSLLVFFILLYKEQLLYLSVWEASSRKSLQGIFQLSLKVLSKFCVKISWFYLFWEIFQNYWSFIAAVLLSNSSGRISDRKTFICLFTIFPHYVHASYGFLKTIRIIILENFANSITYVLSGPSYLVTWFIISECGLPCTACSWS